MGPFSIIGIVSFVLIFLALLVYVLHMARENAKEQDEQLKLAEKKLEEKIENSRSEEKKQKSENIITKSLKEPQTNTILKGVLGELLFSSIGVVIWIIMYQFGILTGLFGVVIMAFALMGWKWFKRKKLPRAAFYGAAVICLFQILVAELLSLVLEVIIKQKVGLIDAFTHVINWFSSGNMGIYILIDLIIGFVVAGLTLFGFVLYQKYNLTYRLQKNIK